MRIVSAPVSRFGGTYTPPGDKSITHRALLASGAASGTSRVAGWLRCADTLHLVTALRSVGVRIEEDGDGLVVRSPGLDGWTEPGNVLNMGNSGTASRLLAGLLATRPFLSVLTGDASLRARPMRRIAEPLRLMGAEVMTRGDGTAPLVVSGGNLRGIAYRLPVASAQIKSCILLAGLGAAGTVTVEEPAPSCDHTERLFTSLGVEIAAARGSISMAGGQRPRAADMTVPGDLSSAAVMIAACLLVGGGELTVRGVGLNPGRTGLLEALSAMGGDIRITANGEIGGEPVGEIRVRPSRLAGIALPERLVPGMIDEIPVFALLAASAAGETVITGAAELRHKEVDRIAKLAAGLTRLGVEVRELPDGLVVAGGARLRSATVPSWGDHRLAMIWTLAGLAADGPVTVTGAQAATTSYPGFYDDLARLTR